MQGEDLVAWKPALAPLPHPTPAKEQGPFPPPCLGPQDMGIYLVSPTLEEGGPGFHSHMFWTVS